MSLLMSPAGQEAILRPVSGASVLLALRKKPRNPDTADMVAAIDRHGLPGWEVRRSCGGKE